MFAFAIPAYLTTHPPFGWAVILLAVLCITWSSVLYLETRGRGKRPVSRNHTETPVVLEIMGTAVGVFAIWLCLICLTLFVMRLCRHDATFDLLLGVCTFSGLPWFLAQATYLFRNRSRRANHLWQAFLVLMLLWMSASVWLGLYRVSDSMWLHTAFASLPLLAAVWSIGISQIRELPNTFRAACRWEVHAGRKVIVYTPPGKAGAEVSEIVAGCDEMLERVYSLLEVAPLQFKPEAFLFPDTETHHNVVGCERRTGTAYGHSDCISLVYAEWHSIDDTVAHELTHVVRAQSIAHDLLPILDEGLACYIESHLTPNRIFPAITLPTSLYVLAQPKVFYDWHYTDITEYPVRQKYIHAHALVEYLIHEYGLDAFKQFCMEVGKNASSDAVERLAKATEHVYNRTLRELEKHWRDTWPLLSSQIIPPPDLSCSWERFSQKARKAIERAQQEAKSLEYHRTATEHLLLGLLHDQDCRACYILKNAGVCLSALREAVLSRVSRGFTPGRGEQFTYDVIHVFNFAFNEARARHSSYIGTEHLLLGLLCTGTGVAFDALDSQGLDADVVRRLWEETE